MHKKKKIGIYSPSASTKYNKDRVELYLKGIEYLKKRGYDIIEGSCTNDKNFFHMSATAKERADEIHELFLNPDIDIIIPSIGGHVASQILNYLDIKLIQNNPKKFLGFSDSSLLASYIAESANIMTFHTGLDITFGFGRLNDINNPLQNNGIYSEKFFWDVIENNIFKNVTYSKWEGLQVGKSKGKLIGGNIKGIQALIGTKFEPNWNNKILYIESIDQPHLIEQILTHFKNADIFNKISGLIIGKMKFLQDTFYKDEIMPINDFIKYIINNEKLPIIVEADIGHDIENITMINNALCHINIKNSTDVEFSIEYGNKNEK